MALIVEDGSALATAESYISEVEADLYFENRGKSDAWDSIEDKEAALRLATDNMEQVYYNRWKGYRKTSTQRLSWPRFSVPIEDNMDWLSYVPDNIVPERVKFACAELAFATPSGDLAPAQERAQSDVTVGPISVTYDSASAQATSYPAVDMLLAPYLKGSSTMVGLIRA